MLQESCRENTSPLRHKCDKRSGICPNRVMWGMWFVYYGLQESETAVVSAVIGRREEIPRPPILSSFACLFLAFSRPTFKRIAPKTNVFRRAAPMNGSNPIADAARSWLTEAVCCVRRKVPGKRDEYDALKQALLRKKEEVRRLQEQCAALEKKASTDEQPLDVLPTDEAAKRIQAVHRGHLSRRGDGQQSSEGYRPASHSSAMGGGGSTILHE